MPSTAAGATAWAVPLLGGSAGQAAAGILGSPTGVTGTCGSGANRDSVVVSWTAAANATTYTLQQSTTSATSGFSTAATGVAGTSWTSPTLGNGSWWFRVVAARNNWFGAASTATAQRVIFGTSCF